MDYDRSNPDMTTIKITCTKCRGTGRRSAARKCGKCGGTGQVQAKVRKDEISEIEGGCCE